MKIKLILILLNLSWSTIHAQTAMEQYTDIYPQELLHNKGILYKKSAEPKDFQNNPYRFVAYDEFGKQRMLTYSNYFSFNTGKNNSANIFSSFIRVIGQGNEYYNLAVEANGIENSGTDYLSVKKVDIDSIGYSYLALKDLINIYKDNPEVMQNVVGYPLKEFELTTWRNCKGYFLRESPNNLSPFISIELPEQVSPFETTVISRNGYWFKLELHFKFIYNGSDNPNFCARSLFDRKYVGYWKANTDDQDYPYLILSMLKPEYWKDFAKLAGK